MKNIVFILISLLALSCNDDGSNNGIGQTASNLVTGINLRQNFDDMQLRLGNPNILVNNKFTIFPNPAVESVFIMAQENITDVWIVPANPQIIYQDENFNTILNTDLYSEQFLNSGSILSLSGQSASDISVNLGTLEKGYYRLFVKIGGEIYWDNLYKYDDQENTETQFNSIIEFWN